MLPQNLIELIETGQAEYKSYATGGSGFCMLQVPKNKHIIITGFSFSHFIDYKNLPFSALELNNGALHTLSFRSADQRFLYNFRTNVNVYNAGTELAPDWKWSPVNDAEKIECYQIHKQDVQIFTIRFTAQNTWLTTYANNSPESNSEGAPAGYGNSIGGGQNAIQEISFGPNVQDAQYLPQSTNSAVAPTSTYRQEMRDDVDINTRLWDIQKSDIYTFPIININYVLIHKPLQ